MYAAKSREDKTLEEILRKVSDEDEKNFELGKCWSFIGV